VQGTGQYHQIKAYLPPEASFPFRMDTFKSLNFGTSRGADVDSGLLITVDCLSTLYRVRIPGRKKSVFVHVGYKYLWLALLPFHPPHRTFRSLSCTQPLSEHHRQPCPTTTDTTLFPRIIPTQTQHQHPHPSPSNLSPNQAVVWSDLVFASNNLKDYVTWKLSEARSTCLGERKREERHLSTCVRALTHTRNAQHSTAPPSHSKARSTTAVGIHKKLPVCRP